MSDVIYDTVVKTSDGELLSACLRIVRDKRAKFIKKIVLNPVNGSNIELSQDQWSSDEIIGKYTARAGRAFRSISLTSGDNKQLVSVNRLLTDRNRSKELFDNLSINVDQFDGSDAEFLDFIDVVQTELRVMKGVDFGPLLGPDVAAHFASREEALSRLEILIANATSNLVSQRGDLDREFQARRNTMEADFSAQKQDLGNKQSELETLRKEIDDRSNTHARRDDRKELLQAISEENRLVLSSETTYRRRWVLYGYIGLLAFLAVSLGLTWVPNLYPPEVADVLFFEYLYLFVRTGLSIGIVVTLGFLIRWLNSFAARSATEDFKLKQLQLDVQRASWLVELYFESIAAGDTVGLPEDLMKQLSIGLFSSEHVETESVTASDALASALLGSAGKLRLNVAGNEIELLKNGLRKLGKTRIENDAD